MSTKRLREVLEELAKTHPHWEAVGKATKELDAIENAARGLYQNDPHRGWDQQAWDDALDLMTQIAGAPQPPPAYPAWTGETWPMPPGYDSNVWETMPEDQRRALWLMRHSGFSMRMREEPTDAELRRYVGEVMAGGPGFAGVKP